MRVQQEMRSEVFESQKVGRRHLLDAYVDVMGCLRGDTAWFSDLLRP